MTLVVLPDDDNPGRAGPRKVVGERADGPADFGLLVLELLLTFYLLALAASNELQHALVVHVSLDSGLPAHRGTVATTLRSFAAVSVTISLRRAIPRKPVVAGRQGRAAVARRDA